MFFFIQNRVDLTWNDPITSLSVHIDPACLHANIYIFSFLIRPNHQFTYRIIGRLLNNKKYIYINLN